MSKKEAMQRLVNEKGIISALAIDQRGALRKMMGKMGTEANISRFKELVSEELTPYASSILLDPEYGLPAAEKRADTAGLLVAYEKTGYDTEVPGRLPDLLPIWSVKRLKQQGADAVKFLLYYDVDEGKSINEVKHAFVERIGSECAAEDIPFYLELLSYDATTTEPRAYAKVKPRKVIEMMKEFSKPVYQVDVLKVEVPVNMNYVEGIGTEASVYTQDEAAHCFRLQSEVSSVPFIFLSAGVSAKLFQETLRFAKQAGSTFNGVLCGRATWKDGVRIFIEQGESEARAWLQKEGRANIEALNNVLQETASSVYTK